MRNLLPLTKSQFSIMLLGILALLFTSVAPADDPPAADDDTAISSETKTKIDRLFEVAAENRTAVAPTAPVNILKMDADTQLAYQQAWQTYYKYLSDGYAFRQRVFNWQDFSTKVIFAIVIILVLLGMYFAAIQFHIGMFGRKYKVNQNKDNKDEENKDKKTQDKDKPPSLDSDVELSFKGIRVRSPVLGVVILVISLAFFYLYLVYVYPISNVV